MKREDLQNYRKSGTYRSFSYRHNCADSTHRSHKLFPCCHFAQLACAALVFIGILCIERFIESHSMQIFLDQLQQHLSSNLSFTSGEWSGSLKDIFSIHK